MVFDWLRWHTLNISSSCAHNKRRGVDGTCTQLESIDESFNLKCQQWMSLQAAALAPHLSAQLICSFRAQMRPTQTCVTTVPLTQLPAVLCNNFPVVNAYFPLSLHLPTPHTLPTAKTCSPCCNRQNQDCVGATAGGLHLMCARSCAALTINTQICCTSLDSH